MSLRLRILAALQRGSVGPAVRLRSRPCQAEGRLEEERGPGPFQTLRGAQDPLLTRPD